VKSAGPTSTPAPLPPRGRPVASLGSRSPGGAVGRRSSGQPPEQPARRAAKPMATAWMRRRSALRAACTSRADRVSRMSHGPQRPTAGARQQSPHRVGMGRPGAGSVAARVSPNGSNKKSPSSLRTGLFLQLQRRHRRRHQTGPMPSQLRNRAATAARIFRIDRETSAL